MSNVCHLYRSPSHFTEAVIQIDGCWYKMKDGLVGESLKGSEARQTLVAWRFRV
jgi:hypothetical protein